LLTHRIPDGCRRQGSSVEYVTERSTSGAVLQATRGRRILAVDSADLMRQCLNAELLDEVQIDLVPVLLGEGVRYFGRI
jgi:dihydrofolate reductase